MSSYVLVTGGAGYIGSHLCKALARQGHIPIAYDNLSTGNKQLVQFGPFIQADILDEMTILKTLRSYKFQAIFHLAALSNARESLQDPKKYQINNVEGTQTLLDALKKEPSGPLVFASTASVYATTITTPITEKGQVAPPHPYGASKYMAEQAIKAFSRQTKTPIALLRYFNVAGAAKDGDIGEIHDPETHLIPLLIQSAIKKVPFTLLHTNHPTKDGTAQRDYIHVEDIVEGTLKAWSYIQNTKKNVTLNLGSGIGFTVREIIEKIEDKMEMKVLIQQGLYCFEPPCSISDPSKAKKLLQWKASNSSLDYILDTAIKWEREKI